MKQTRAIVDPQVPGEFDLTFMPQNLDPNRPKEQPYVMRHLGNNITTYEAPYVHYMCGCSRQFKDQEMYVCFRCTKALCKFCVCRDEIETFWCVFCLDT
jgi:hypothetical protein